MTTTAKCCSSPSCPPLSSTCCSTTSADHKALGNKYFQDGQFDNAVESFTCAISCSGDSSSEQHVLYSNRSGAYASLKKYKEALQDAEMCVKLNYKWPKGYSRMGLALHNLGRHEEAEKAYDNGLKIDPENAALKEGLKNVQNSNSSMDDLQTMLSVMQAVKSNPKLQKYSEEDPQYIERLTGILKMIRVNPQGLASVLKDPDPRLREGLMAAMGVGSEDPSDDSPYVYQPTPKKDEKAKQPEMSEAEKEAEGWKLKGNDLYKQRKFEEALQAYDKAIETNPSDIAYHSNKGAVYIEMGEYEKCIAECQKAIDKRYESKASFDKIAKVYNRMAVCYHRQDRLPECIAMYEKSLLEDSDKTIRSALKDAQRLYEKRTKQAYLDPVKAEEHREKGNEFFNLGDYPQAKHEYDEAIKRNPTDAKVYGNRSATLTKLAEFPGALKDCDKALELDPTFVKCWLRKGNLHFSLKENHKSMEAFAKALELDPTNTEARDGRMKVMMKVQETSRSSEVDQEQYRHAMADPEIQQILSDPQFNMILKEITENPASLKNYMNDPKIAAGISKLMTAGILRTG
eukprot:GHVS01058597.1.p1 GENE.GHVS01058597.1~~GHVS01058597.1.p1  ORF type:complete len:572 (-),score=92.44 GHVS01058597.1:60-1775(-)